MRPLMIALGIAGVLVGTIPVHAQWGPATPPGPIGVLKPDLVCEWAQVQGEFTARVSIKNIGTLTSGNSTVRVWVPFFMGAFQNYSDASVPALLPGQHVTRTLTIWGLGFASHNGGTATCTVDLLNQVSELNESNNVFSFPWVY